MGGLWFSEKYFPSIFRQRNRGFNKLVFITIYLIYLGKRNIGLALLFNEGLLAVVFGIVLLLYFIVNPDVSGYVAMFFNILMYAAPR
jgi:hypothetical protein